MTIIIRKEKHETHFFECVRDDGTRTGALLVSRSFLTHDFLHFAVESLAGLKNSFYGLVAQGKELQDLIPKDGEEAEMIYANDEARTTEMVVGMLTGLLKSGADEKTGIEALKNIFKASSLPFPDYLTPDFIQKVKVRMRHLLGEYNALQLGETMILTYTV